MRSRKSGKDHVIRTKSHEVFNTAQVEKQGEFERIFGFSFRFFFGFLDVFRPGGTNNINWTPPSRKSWRFHPPRRTAYAFWPRWKRCVGVGGEWCWGRVNALGIGKHKTSGKTGKIHTDPSIWKWIRHVFHWFNFQRFHWFTFSGKFEDEDVESCCKSKISRFSTTKKLAGTTPRQRYRHDFPQIRCFVISGHVWLVGFDRRKSRDRSHVTWDLPTSKSPRVPFAKLRLKGLTWHSFVFLWVCSMGMLSYTEKCPVGVKDWDIPNRGWNVLGMCKRRLAV